MKKSILFDILTVWKSGYQKNSRQLNKTLLDSLVNKSKVKENIVRVTAMFLALLNYLLHP